jgi:hypothetical protein
MNEKGWVNEETMKSWIIKAWKKRSGTFMNPKSVLVLDSCRVHLMENVKKELSKCSQLAIIPGGLTKKLQPLDISVNRSFKSKLRKKWEQWMIDGIKLYTKSGTLKKASYSEIYQCIVDSWKDISDVCVKNGFNKMLNDELSESQLENDFKNEEGAGPNAFGENEEETLGFLTNFDSFEAVSEENFDGFV